MLFSEFNPQKRFKDFNLCTNLVSRLNEALKLNIPSKVIIDADLNDYLTKVDTQTQSSKDMLKPIVHRSHLVQKANITPVDDNQDNSNAILLKSNNPNDKWDLDNLRQLITQRPTTVLKDNGKMKKSTHVDALHRNTKMKKSAIGGKIFYNFTLPALNGLVVDESTGDFLIVVTCPGAGSCKKSCYGRKGGYRLYPPSSLSASRMLNFLVNDPQGFTTFINNELHYYVNRRYQGITNPQIVVRWHDTGDFFSDEYIKVVFDIANKNKNITFYAYTKSANVFSHKIPSNFIFTFSDGATTTQTYKFNTDYKGKAKESYVVPKELFKDLVERVEYIGTSRTGKPLKPVKQLVFKDPSYFHVLAKRIAEKYKVPVESFITQKDLLSMDDVEDNRLKFSVITMPSDGDNAATRHDVLYNFLIFH